jgi:GTP-binding protein
LTSSPVIPVVAIVGRPNVGKSTLFNRLTGTRAALVSDLPGLTRDRREGVADLLGTEVRLVDTAGLEEAQRGSIADRMRKQSEQAIADADLVLFVIDARAGVTAADTGFARIARQSGKPVVLVANKAEGSRVPTVSSTPSRLASARRSPFPPSTARASAISPRTCSRRSG